MKKKMTDDIEKCCSLCEHARKIEISGDVLCTRSKNIKKVSDNFSCRHFSFDILAYKPNPTKIPKFRIDSLSDIL